MHLHGDATCNAVSLEGESRSPKHIEFRFTGENRAMVCLHPPVVFAWQLYDRDLPEFAVGRSEGRVVITFKTTSVHNLCGGLVVFDQRRI